MISELLKSSGVLTELDLSCDEKKMIIMILCNDEILDNWIWTGNNVGDEGAEKISEALQTNKTLTSLNLSRDDILKKEVKVLKQ